MRIHRHLSAVPVTILASVLLAAPVALAVGKGSADGAGRGPAVAHIGFSAARDLGPENRCAKPVPAASASRMGRREWLRATRRLRRNCLRAATDSAAPGAPIYWGATIGDQLTGEQAPWDMAAVTKFEETAGKKVSLINFFSPFANCESSCSFYEFPSKPMENIRRHGAIPVLSWSSQSIPSSLNEPDFQLSDVINGTYDAYIREFAEAAREWGHPFFLRFDWEMNGNWFPWSEGVNGNQSGEFVAAWRHVHDIFTQVGATNTTWVWCPNVDPENNLQNLSSLYPGDEYVDWTGLDGYNWGTNPAKPDRWRSFDELYASTYQGIADSIAPSKPLVISEIGSTEYGGSKADWITEALNRIPTAYPKIHGLVWFDTYDDGMDWPIESSTSASSAFAAGIGGPEYATSAYANLSGGPIQPPN